MTNENMQVSVYRVDQSLFPDKGNEEIISQIIDRYNQKVNNKEKEFNQQELKAEVNLKTFNVKIFFAKKAAPPKWKSFLRPVLDNNSALLQGVNRDVSYIAFIYNRDNLFAISGGHGNFVIQDYIEQNFGIQIISRLITKDSEAIKCLQERGLTGVILANTKFFREDRKLADEDDFGKIYKQIQAELKKEVLTGQLGFDVEEIKKNVGCIAKSSFRINKSLNFDMLLDILVKIDSILKGPVLVTLNKVSLISKRGEGSKALLSELENSLYHQLHTLYNTEHCGIEFDFCHPDYEKYLIASKYKVYQGQSKNALFECDTLDDINYLFGDIKSRATINADNVDNLRNDLDKITVESYDGDGNILTPKTKIVKHLHCELKDRKGNTYFYVDTEWYQIQSDFIDDLNIECHRIINETFDDKILQEAWGSSQNNEDEYNLKYLGKENFYVLHKITPENIELCDILNINENDFLFLIHVKKGFNASMRDLTSQIAISSRRILEDTKSNRFEYIGKVYDELKAKSKSDNPYFKKITAQVNKLTRENFVNIFKRKQFIFCLAVLDIAENRNIKSGIKDFESNIAKFSLIELYRKLDRDSFKVTQIKKSISTK